MTHDFTNSELRQYFNYLDGLMVERVRTVGLIVIPLALVLLSFGYTVGGEVLLFTLYLSIMGVALGSTSYMLSSQNWFSRIAFLYAGGATILFLLAVLLLIYKTEVYPDIARYYAALCGIFLFFHISLPFRFLQAAIVVSAVVMVMVGGLLVLDEVPVVQAELILLFAALFLAESYTKNQLALSNFVGKLRLEKEQKRSEDLLLNMLPPSIAMRLKESSDTRIADTIGEATVLFADLVGFTPLSVSRLPSNIVEIIDRVFTRFDLIMLRHRLEKIKTIGDAYMAVAGAPNESRDHGFEAAAAALEMRESLYEFNKETGEELDIRIGLHSGPIVAGVIGTTKKTYDIWGDTVNTASRMESHSENGAIQLSEQTYHLIKTEFETTYRGEIEVKGKGTMKTHYLIGRERQQVKS